MKGAPRAGTRGREVRGQGHGHRVVEGGADRAARGDVAGLKVQLPTYDLSPWGWGGGGEGRKEIMKPS